MKKVLFAMILMTSVMSQASVYCEGLVSTSDQPDLYNVVRWSSETLGFQRTSLKSGYFEAVDAGNGYVSVKYVSKAGSTSQTSLGTKESPLVLDLIKDEGMVIDCYETHM
jgi:hypothetical protein